MWARLGRVLGDDGPMGRSLAALLLVAAWVATWRPQVDPDAWWHIALGEAILHGGGIPAVEPFSWLTAGDRFVAHSWLWDVLMAVAHGVAGMTGTSLLSIPITAGIVGLSWALIGTSAPEIGPVARSTLVLAAVVAALPLWAPRAQSLDVLFILAIALVVARYLRSGRRSELLVLPLVGFLWANLHGSALLGLLAMLAIALVATPMGARWGQWPGGRSSALAVAAVAALVAASVNPYGPALFLYPFDRDVASAFSVDIIEWRAPDFRASELLFARLLLAGLLLLVVAWPRRRRDPFLLLAAAAWTFAALGSVRFLPVAAAVIVAATASVVGPSIGRWLGIHAGRPTERSAVPAGRPMLAIAVVASVVVLAVGASFIAPPAQVAAIAHRLPVAAIEALESRPCDGRLLPAYTWAGYVIEATDREVGAYGNSAERPLAEQAAAEAVITDPRPWLDANEIEIALMPATGPLSHWLDEADDWRIVYRDPQATVHVRADRTDCGP